MRNVKAEPCHRSFHINLFPILLLLAVCMILQTVHAQPAGTVTVFEGARLIPGNGNGPIEDAVFIIENDRFTAVGRRSEVPIPDGATRINLSGKTVMPAIVDAHKHLSGEREQLITQLRDLAYFGVGTVLSLGQDVTDVPFEVHEESIPGTAREYTAGRGITMPEPGRPEVAYWITTEEQARQAVREQVERNVDMIKIWVDDRDGKYKKLTPALYGAIIDEAHKNNTKVAAHIFKMDDAKGLLRAGIDVFAHGVRDQDIDAETVELFKQHPDVVVVPNLPERGVATDMSWLKGSIIPDAEVAKLQAASKDDPEAQKFFGIQARNMDKLHNAGVKIAFGTDGGILWEHHIEMANMVAAGMTPAEVIVSATRNSAELIGLSDTGVIASGNLADFIVLDANPLENITNTRRISSVYVRGAQVER